MLLNIVIYFIVRYWFMAIVMVIVQSSIPKPAENESKIDVG